MAASVFLGADIFAVTHRPLSAVTTNVSIIAIASNTSGAFIVAEALQEPPPWGTRGGVLAAFGDPAGVVKFAIGALNQLV